MYTTAICKFVLACTRLSYILVDMLEYRTKNIVEKVRPDERTAVENRFLFQVFVVFLSLVRGVRMEWIGGKLWSYPCMAGVCYSWRIGGCDWGYWLARRNLLHFHEENIVNRREKAIKNGKCFAPSEEIFNFRFHLVMRTFRPRCRFSSK